MSAWKPFLKESHKKEKKRERELRRNKENLKKVQKRKSKKQQQMQLWLLTQTGERPGQPHAGLKATKHTVKFLRHQPAARNTGVGGWGGVRAQTCGPRGRVLCQMLYDIISISRSLAFANQH